MTIAEIMIITQQAKLIRLGVDKIRKTGRSAQGVTLIKTRRRRPRHQRIAARGCRRRRRIDLSIVNNESGKSTKKLFAFRFFIRNECEPASQTLKPIHADQRPGLRDSQLAGNLKSDLV